MKRSLTILLALAGIALFVYVVWRAGPERIWDTLQKISPLEFLILILLRFLFWGLRALNWQAVLTRCGDRAGFLHLLNARMAGHALGYLTPTSRIGGDAFKALMVEKVPQRRVIASVIIDKTIELLATALLIPVGLGILVWSAALPRTQTLTYLGATILMLSLVIWLIYQQKQGFFTRLLNLLNRFRLGREFRRRHESKIAETDTLMSYFYSRHRDRFALVFAGYLVFIGLWAVEIYVSLRFLGCADVTLEKSFLIIILGSVAFILPGVPGSVGIYEMTYLSIFALLGMGASQAIGLILVRRALDILMAAWGLAVILRRGRGAWRRIFPGRAGTLPAPGNRGS